MDSKTWERIKSELKKAHPLARIRKLHPIIRNPKIPKKIRDEAKELAKKARLELDQEHFWKWGGVSLLPSRSPRLEEEVKEEGPRKTLEQTVDTAAPTKKEEPLAQTAYSSKPEDEYFGKSYTAKKQYTSEPESARGTVDATATASEIAAGEAKYHRKKKEQG